MIKYDIYGNNLKLTAWMRWPDTAIEYGICVDIIIQYSYGRDGTVFWGNCYKYSKHSSQIYILLENHWGKKIMFLHTMRHIYIYIFIIYVTWYFNVTRKTSYIESMDVVSLRINDSRYEGRSWCKIANATINVFCFLCCESLTNALMSNNTELVIHAPV